jgi:hypothetical protein
MTITEVKGVVNCIKKIYDDTKFCVKCGVNEENILSLK